MRHAGARVACGDALRPADDGACFGYHRRHMSENEGTLFLVPAPKKASATGPAALVFIAPPGPLLGKRFELKAGESVMGRLDELAIPCVADGVSRRHAKI